MDIMEENFSLDDKDSSGRTMLDYAILRKDEGLVRYLVYIGADTTYLNNSVKIPT